MAKTGSSTESYHNKVVGFQKLEKYLFNMAATAEILFDKPFQT